MLATFDDLTDGFWPAYFNWHARKHPGATKGVILRDLSNWVSSFYLTIEFFFLP